MCVFFVMINWNSGMLLGEVELVSLQYTHFLSTKLLFSSIMMSTLFIIGFGQTDACLLYCGANYTSRLE